MLKYLVDSYLSYRKSQEKEFIHPNFHGARDFYYIIKYIFNEMKNLLIDKNTDNIEEKVLCIIHTGIDMNFNGL